MSLKHLFNTLIPGYGRVSTIFLGLDYSFGDGPPLLFETMSFTSDHSDDVQERCSTYAEAVAMHARIVATVRSRR